MKKLQMIICAVFISTSAYAALNDYLITQPIGVYQIEKPPPKVPLMKKTRLKQKPWSPFSAYSSAGPLQGTGHFNVDHRDTTYRVVYENDAVDMTVRVHVTQHPGVNSDKWLLHEVEGKYRDVNQPDKFRGMIKTFRADRIITYLKGTHYMWLSNNVVVDVSYIDSRLTKPEPLEIVNAYLQKFPSTLPPIIFDRAHDALWIKDEMDRFLWLADKRFAQITPDDPDIADTINSLIGNLEEFLEYREKYFSISSANDKQLLATYVEAGDITSLGKKLEELNMWWKDNKSASITLPG